MKAVDCEMVELEDAAERDWLTCQVKLAELVLLVPVLVTEMVDPAAPGAILKVFEGLVE